MMLSSARLPVKRSKTMASLKLLQIVWFTLCIGVVLMLYLLHFTNIVNNGTILTDIVSSRQVVGYPFSREYESQMSARYLDNSSKVFDVHVNQTTSISYTLQEFRHEWLRQRRSRVDWMNIIKPCADQMAWDLVKEGWGKINRSNAVTSHVTFQDIRPAGEFSKIFIQSKTSDNRKKMIGGDTWRVYARGPSSTAATVFDHNNGTYEALFLIKEPGVYQLMIYLDYSLCDGFKDPPTDWFSLGDAYGRHQKDGILGPLNEYLVKQAFMDGRPLKITVHNARLNISLLDKLEGLGTCSQNCRLLWDGFGEWNNGQWRPHVEESYTWFLPRDYTQSGTFWIYGDSLGLRLFSSVKRRSLCKSLYKQCKYSYTWIYPGTNKDIVLKDAVDFNPSKVIKAIVNVLRRPEMKENGSVLLLNLLLHFENAVNFTTYQKLIDDLILALKETEVNSQGELVPKYMAKVIWKSGTAIHKEKAKSLNRTCFRFLTSQRIALFNAYSMSAMCKAGFDVIDVYPLTDSYPSGTIDHVHYAGKVFDMLERMLEKYKVHDNKILDENEQNGKIKRCISQDDF